MSGEKYKSFNSFIEAESFARANDGQMQPVRGWNNTIIPDLYYVVYTPKPKKKVYRGVYSADEMTFYIDNKPCKNVGQLDTLLMDFSGKDIIITIEEARSE